MNKAILMGRLTRDPDVRWTQGQDQRCVARFTLAVDRRGSKEGQQSADFLPCVAFGKLGEFVEKYLHKGMKVIVDGRIQTGSYTNRDGVKVYTTDIICNEIEFAESKAAQERAAGQQSKQPDVGQDGDGFMNIPEGVDEELPFS